MARKRSYFSAGFGPSETFAGARFALDVWSVMGLRIAKIAVGGPAAVVETHRMVAEKVAAGWEAQTRATLALMSGSSHTQAHAQAHAVYRRHVRANRRRLGAGG